MLFPESHAGSSIGWRWHSVWIYDKNYDMALRSALGDAEAKCTM